MTPRIFNKTREKMLLLCLFLVINGCVIYFYILYTQETIKTAEWTKGRCFSELTSTKYQLNVVTEYKNKVDKMLADTQKSYESDKNKFKGVLESCIGIKQQSLVCQNQFEDLQIECKKSKKHLNEINKQHQNLKDHTSILQQKNEKLQAEVLELIDKVEELHKENLKLTNEVHIQIPETFEMPAKTYLGKSFSKQVEEDNGVYKIEMHSNADLDIFSKLNATPRA